MAGTPATGHRRATPVMAATAEWPAMAPRPQPTVTAPATAAMAATAGWVATRAPLGTALLGMARLGRWHVSMLDSTPAIASLTVSWWGERTRLSRVLSL